MDDWKALTECEGNSESVRAKRHRIGNDTRRHRVPRRDRRGRRRLRHLVSAQKLVLAIISSTAVILISAGLSESTAGFPQRFATDQLKLLALKLQRGAVRQRPRLPTAKPRRRLHRRPALNGSDIRGDRRQPCGDI